MATLSPNKTVSDVMDRMHAIHQTLSVSGETFNAQRYYPTNLEELPAAVVITPSMPVSVSFNQLSNRQYEVTRTYQVRAWVRAWTGGIPGESAQKSVEAVMPAIEAAYLTRPRLELNDNGIVVGSRFTTGQSFGNDRLRATLTYNLLVFTHEDIQP